MQHEDVLAFYKYLDFFLAHHSVIAKDYLDAHQSIKCPYYFMIFYETVSTNLKHAAAGGHIEVTIKLPLPVRSVPCCALRLIPSPSSLIMST